MNARKILCTALGMLLIVSAMTVLVSAAPKTTVDYNVYKVSTAPKMDGVIGDEEYGDCEWIKFFDERLNATTWVAGQTIPTGLDIQYKFAWDDSYLYIAVKVTGDDSPSQNAAMDTNWFGKGDMTQIFLNPEYKVIDVSPLCLDIGFTPGGVASVMREHLGDIIQKSSEFPGYSTKYDEAVGGYTAEVSVPWKYILFDTDTVKTSGVEVKDGTVFGACFVYSDAGGAISYIKTDGELWSGTEFCSVKLTLKNTPAQTTAAPVASAASVAPTAPATADVSVILASVAAAALAGAFFSRKKNAK